MPESYEILGLMSGSSLDGLDLAWCSFRRERSDLAFSYELEETVCIPFTKDLQEKLACCREMSALELIEAEADFVRFSADCIKNLCDRKGKKPLAVASHGHTVFHHPAGGYTLQIGNGGLLHGLCGIPVVSDFRTVDVGLGGQGAPLVPGAEAELFSEFTACLNLGGICNVSFPGKQTTGFDIGPCNQLLNFVSLLKGKAYDEDGKMAAEGRLIPELLEQLNANSFYRQPVPRSLSNEMVAESWTPLLLAYRQEPENVLHTLCLHIAACISEVLPSGGKMLVSGGGVFNLFLMDSIQKACEKTWQIIPADEKLAGSKEALCFAWLGLKRLLEEVNVPASVTGARSDSVSGALYGLNPVGPIAIE
jgi:anhydro-N-acetylmuramic acid kinase